MVELLVATTVALITSLALLQFVDWSRRTYVVQSDQANSQSVGRAAMELMSQELRRAGYSPLGVSFDALPAAAATGFRVLADIDGDGDVSSAGETNENITYVFVDPDGDGLFLLRRGVDLDGNGVFTGTGESIETVLENVVAVDIDDDGTDEDFVVLDTCCAVNANRVTLSFGIRSDHRDPVAQTWDVVTFTSAVTLRNRLLQ